MQKAILFFLIVLVSTTFLSCSKVKAFEGTFQTARTKLLDKLSVSTTKDNKEIAGKIVEGIKEKDVVKIKSLFSKQSLAEMHDIDKKCFVYYPNYEGRKFRMNVSYYKINLNEPDLEGVVSIEFYQQEKYNEPVEIIIIGNRRV
jgi:phage pi2 protein 07